jgi:hypothetical protein
MAAGRKSGGRHNSHGGSRSKVWNSSVAQVLAKIPGEPLEDRLAEPERATPCMPLNHHSRSKLHKLNAVVMDYLIETVSHLSDKLKRDRARENNQVPRYLGLGPTQQIVSKIIEPCIYDQA